MKRGCLFVILLVAVLSAQAQKVFTLIQNKEGKIIAIPKYPDFEFNIPKFAYKSYTPASTQELEMKLRGFVPETPLSVDERPMDMQIQSAAYRPYFNVFTPMLQKVSPMALDFDETVLKPLNDNLSFMITGRQFTWPGAGGITDISPQFVWHQDKWMVSGGGFAGRFYTPFNPSPGFMGGFNTQISYSATDWLRLRAWGQYTMYDKNNEKNSFVIMNPSYNHTAVGSALEFKFTEDFGMGVGVQYEFNPIKQKMERQVLFFPILGK
ncbi:hypothetical protein [Parabacteroides bouchesdurhonensis]|uniref:hypothetical protein n=1 Tax=Parabacteroides bouchesdurhonensis TaxID=1936995 RepID=UPI000E4CD179|nr:hypothetical protein [Parabacteroides bouchesdurhonensis]RHJ93107.1 hypothetical protein DW095_06430 [Bacteroides sp. AM07-16]